LTLGVRLVLANQSGSPGCLDPDGWLMRIPAQSIMQMTPSGVALTFGDSRYILDAALSAARIPDFYCLIDYRWRMGAAFSSIPHSVGRHIARTPLRTSHMVAASSVDRAHAPHLGAELGRAA
ncbi:MAG TPA: hypothetical protein VJS42_17395, partial [Steroidobacteraceae bacterium]|nr:hypothetical protein [Steroidobacteraceae bacterium]